MSDDDFQLGDVGMAPFLRRSMGASHCKRPPFVVQYVQLDTTNSPAIIFQYF